VTTVAFVACSKTKLEQAAAARNLYQGKLFLAARAWAEARCDRWYILSARHGLVAPTRKLEPYDESLETRSEQERREWAWRVFHQIRDLREHQMFPDPEATYEIIFLTGQNYRRYLAGDLRAAGYTVSEPLAGLPYARQVARLKQWLQEDRMLNVTNGRPVSAAPAVCSHQDAIFQEIAAELARQRELWGRQLHQPLYWNAILGEEVGEINKALVDYDLANLRRELIQVAAVAVSFAISLDESNGRR